MFKYGQQVKYIGRRGSFIPHGSVGIAQYVGETVNLMSVLFKEPIGLKVVKKSNCTLLTYVSDVSGVVL